MSVEREKLEMVQMFSRIADRLDDLEARKVCSCSSGPGSYHDPIEVSDSEVSVP